MPASLRGQVRILPGFGVRLNVHLLAAAGKVTSPHKPHVPAPQLENESYPLAHPQPMEGGLIARSERQVALPSPSLTVVHVSAAVGMAAAADNFRPSSVALAVRAAIFRLVCWNARANWIGAFLSVGHGFPFSIVLSDPDWRGQRQLAAKHSTKLVQLARRISLRGTHSCWPGPQPSAGQFAGAANSLTGTRLSAGRNSLLSYRRTRWYTWGRDHNRPRIDP